jgi:Uma2 family endonuclease
MNTAEKQRTVYEEFLAVPDHLVAEIINGTLRTFPRPASRHARVSSRLGIRLGPFDGDQGGPDAPGGWVILDEPELRFLGHIVVPDLAGWRRERMPEMPDAPFFELVPDWICEVLSPSTAKIDREEKMAIYAEGGVRHAWLIDPREMTFEVYALNPYALKGGEWRLIGKMHGDNVAVRAEPFFGLDFNLSELWAR